MKNEKFYKPLLYTLGVTVTIVIVLYYNDNRKHINKEGLTDMGGNTIYLETPIEPNGYIDQMVDDSKDVEASAQNLLTTHSSTLSSTEQTNLSNIVTNQQNIQTGLTTIKTDYNTVLTSLQNEVNSLVTIRTDALEEKKRSI